MSVRRAVVVLSSLLAACALTADLDGLSRPLGGAGASTPDGAGVDVLAPGPGLVDAGAPDVAAESGVLSYGDVIRADRPLAYFPLDELPGAQSAAEVVGGLVGTVVGKITFGVPGVAGTAASVSGEAHINFGDVLDFTGRRAWTFEAWLRPEPSNAVFYNYFEKRAGTANGVVVYVRNEDGLRAQIEQSYGGGGRGVQVELPTPDHFIHVVFTYDPAKGVRGWVDGVAGPYGYDDSGGPTDNDVDFSILGGYRGAADELAVYDYVLPDDRIRAHWLAGQPR